MVSCILHSFELRRSANELKKFLESHDYYHEFMSIIQRKELKHYVKDIFLTYDIENYKERLMDWALVTHKLYESKYSKDKLKNMITKWKKHCKSKKD